MHFQLVSTITLLALANAAPFDASEDNNSTTSVSERSINDKGWIQSHFKDHCNTNGDIPADAVKGHEFSKESRYMTGPRVYIDNNPKACVPFGPQTNWIGVNWGTGTQAFGALEMHSKSDCSGQSRLFLKHPGASGDCAEKKEFAGLSAVRMVNK